MFELELPDPGTELTDNLWRRELGAVAPVREFRRGPSCSFEHTKPVRFGLRHAASLARCGFPRKRIEKSLENRESYGVRPEPG
jgi:hypothetical protein